MVETLLNLLENAKNPAQVALKTLRKTRKALRQVEQIQQNLSEAEDIDKARQSYLPAQLYRLSHLSALTLEVGYFLTQAMKF